MKSLPEALDMFEKQVQEYQIGCFQDGLMRTDAEAFFSNFFSLDTRYSGKTGYLRAEKFLHQIKSQPFSNTEDLLKFVIHYPDRGFNFSSQISSVIKKIAGIEEFQLNRRFMMQEMRVQQGPFFGTRIPKRNSITQIPVKSC